MDTILSVYRMHTNLSVYHCKYIFLILVTSCWECSAGELVFVGRMVPLSFNTTLKIEQKWSWKGGDLPSGWSLIRVVSHQGSLSSGWSLTKVVFHQGSLSSGFLLYWAMQTDCMHTVNIKSLYIPDPTYHFCQILHSICLCSFTEGFVGAFLAVILVIILF